MSANSAPHLSTRYRRFESISLQHGVRCEPEPRHPLAVATLGHLCSAHGHLPLRSASVTVLPFWSTRLNGPPIALASAVPAAPRGPSLSTMPSRTPSDDEYAGEGRGDQDEPRRAGGLGGGASHRSLPLSASLACCPSACCLRHRRAGRSLPALRPRHSLPWCRPSRSSASAERSRPFSAAASIPSA